MFDDGENAVRRRRRKLDWWRGGVMAWNMITIVEVALVLFNGKLS